MDNQTVMAAAIILIGLGSIISAISNIMLSRKIARLDRHIGGLGLAFATQATRISTLEADASNARFRVNDLAGRVSTLEHKKSIP